MSKAFPLFKDRHVQDITACTTNNKSFFQAKCLPEMKKNTIYTIRLVLDKNSADIEYTQCGCAAGRGPTGSCKHIAAMCYVLEDFYLVHQLRECVSSTSLLQTWKQPRKRTLEATEIRNIKFVQLEYGKQKRIPKTINYDPHPTPLQHTLTEKVQLLRQSLEHKGNVAFLHVLPKPVTTSLTATRLPPIPRSSVGQTQYQLKQCAQSISLRDMFNHCDIMVTMLTPSLEDIVAIEKATRRQHESKQ